MRIKRNKPCGEKILHFSGGFFNNAEFESSDSSNAIVKKALVLVEGTHVDSAKKTHTFTPERIQKIVNNTNQFLTNGGRIPLLRDHKKEQGSTIGDVEGELFTKVITEDDLPNPKYKHLLGKIGAFATKVVAKGRSVVDDISAGLISTISPGIDVSSDCIKEISATPIPAIVGLSLFHRGSGRRANFSERGIPYGHFAFTLDEAEMEQQDMEQLKEEAEDLLEKLFYVFESISAASEEELEGQDPFQLQQQALDDFIERLRGIIGLTEDQMPLSEEEEMKLNQLAMRKQLQQGGVPGGSDPNFLKRQQGLYSENMANQALFTMHDLEVYQSGRSTANFARRAGSKDKAPRKRRLMKAAAIGGGLAGAAVAGRYGMAAARGIGKARGLNKEAGMKIASKRKYAMQAVKNAFGADKKRARALPGAATSAAASGYYAARSGMAKAGAGLRSRFGKKAG